MGIPPTGKAVSILWMDMHRIQGGQVVESWHIEDIAGMLQQLGVTPG
jgi:predicted ester cyclase